MENKIHLTPKELAEKWAEHEVQLPRIPFFLINLYQFCIPLLFITIIDMGIVYLFRISNLAMVFQILLFPLIFIFDVFFAIWSMSKMCKLLHIYYNKKSPAKEDIYSRKFANGNVEDLAVHYYHLRGFMYKWPVWVAKKSFFPWMINFVLRDMADNDIHEDAIYGDSYVSLEFTKLEENAVIMEGCTISSHVVDSIFGNLTVKHVTAKKNAVLHATGVMAPGGVIEENTAVAPRAFVVKNQKAGNDRSKFLWGTPAKKYSYFSFLDILPEKFCTQWEM